MMADRKDIIWGEAHSWTGDDFADIEASYGDLENAFDDEWEETLELTLPDKQKDDIKRLLAAIDQDAGDMPFVYLPLIIGSREAVIEIREYQNRTGATASVWYELDADQREDANEPELSSYEFSYDEENGTISNARGDNK